MMRLLFFTPVMPGETGQGTAIRAGIALELLAETFEVTVVHVDLWTGDRRVADPFWPRKRAAAYHFVPSPVAPNAAEQLVRQHLSSAPFDAVYVFRLVAAPLALRVITLLAAPPATTVLDLDDDECARTERLFALRNGSVDSGSVDSGPADAARAAREQAELHRLRGFARLMLLRFDLCLLAADQDRATMAAQYPGRRFALLPNVMRIPEEQTAAPTRQAAQDGRLLFIGTLDYFPNEDGVLYFANSILPLLLQSTQPGESRPIEFRVVGIKAPRSFEQLAGRPGVNLVGAVRDVAPEYAQARLMVVPLRAGSGTRIKILEAFRYGVPVVSTTIGAAGLDVRDGIHLLIADTPEEFAAACLRLLEDNDLAATLAANAFTWLRQTHSLDRARAVLHSLFEQPVRASACGAG